MRKYLLSLTLLIGFSQASFAQFGKCTASEMQTYVDKVTGHTVTMLTDTLKNDRFLYQTDPMWTADGKYLLFRSSSRDEGTQIYLIEMATGQIIQATQGPNLGSAFLANRSNRMFVSRKEKTGWNLYVMDLEVIDTEFTIGHIQASRFTPGEIVFCNETGGDAHQRMWFCTADGSVFKSLYKETPLDWVTHETFATKDFVYFNILGFQPRLRKQVSGIARINLRTDDVELIGQVEMEKDRKAMEGQLTGRGFWHCNASRDNRWAAGDTFGGNVWLMNVETGERHWLVSDTKMKPDHAHPSFSPDGTKVLFQSGHFTNGKRLNLMMVDITSIK